MRVKKHIAFCIAITFAFVCNSLQGQSTKVSGILVDSLSNTTEVAATVQFYKLDDNTKPVAYTTTDENGKFTHNLSEMGEYRLVLDNLGKKKKSVNFSLSGQPEIDLGTIMVEEDATMIDEVTITALGKLVEINVDKITYNVAADVESKTKSVLDILRKIPLVSVDGTGKITVNGNSSFLVYMDGRKNQIMTENPTDVFRSMPALMVKDIEVITDPGARYDAEGVGGVLNITSNFASMDEESGDIYNGSISAGGSIRKLNGGIFSSAKKDKWTFSVNLSGVKANSGNTELYTERIQQLDNGKMTTITTGTSRDLGIDIFADISASYEINKNNLITFSAGTMDIDSKIRTELATSIDYPGNEYRYSESGYTKMRSEILNANIDYQHTSKAKPGRTFVVSYQLNGRPSENSSDNCYTPGNPSTGTMNDRKDNVFSNSMTHNIQSDFILPLAKGHRLNIGEKFMFRHNMSDVNSHIKENGQFVPDNQDNMNYDFYNNIGAVYAEYNGTLKKFKLRAGLRYEHTWQKAKYNNINESKFKLDYGNLVPNASIQYEISPSQNIGISYSMSIKRPGITYLNPYVNVSDPSSKTYGNPSLKAENGHQIALSYNLYSQKWMAMIKLQQVFKDNGISAYSFYDNSHILNKTYGNLVNSSKTGLSTYISWEPAQKTRISVNGTASYYVLESNRLEIDRTGWLYDFNADLQQILPSNFVCNLSVYYLPNILTLQSKTNGIWNSMLSVSKSCLKEKLNISLSGVVALDKGSRTSMKTVTTGNDFIYTNNMRMPWNDVILNLTYSFGGKDYIDVKKSKRKKLADDQLDLE